MKIYYTILLLLISSSIGAAQEKPPQLYNPNADAGADIRKAISIAADENKHVLIQIGGDWCTWCVIFDTLITRDKKIDSLLTESFILVRVNYSKEKQNLPVLAQFGYPQRFGIPVFVILDAQGNRLHTQDSGFLESGDHHDPEKVMTFLRNWTPKAVDPIQYEKK